MIVETVIQMTLDGQRFVQELFVKIFLRRLTEQDALGVIVFPRSISSSSHLNEIRDGIVIVLMPLPKDSPT